MKQWEKDRFQRLLEEDRRANYYKPPYLRDTLIGTVIAVVVFIWIGWVFL